MMRAAEAIDSALWAIEPEWLETIRAVALGEGEGPEAVAARLGRPLQNAQQVVQRDNVAVIPVTGPIFRYANLFTEVSGATSIEIFARDLRAALDNPAIKGIVLDINSPGGQVDGVNEAANMIRAGTQEKTIIAYVSGLAASAGYWLASAAKAVVVDDTAQLGSIGVVTTVMRKRAAKGEPESVEIVSSQSPNKRPDAFTDEGRAQIQSRVDAIADVFVDAVARFREVDRATVLSQFGGGSVKVGAHAIEVGMADSEGSLEQVISQLAAGQMPPKRRRMRMAAETTVKTYTEDEFKAAVDKSLDEGMKLGLEEGRKTGVVEGAKAERERLTGIEAKTLPGYDSLAAECKADGTSVADFVMKQTDAQKAAATKHLDKLRADAAKVVVPPANPSTTGDPKPVVEDSQRPLEERAKATWDNDAQLRGEFQDNFDSYLAWRKAEATGNARILRLVSNAG